MSDTDCLSRIPSECLAAASQSLPDATTTDDPHYETTIELPDHTRVLITFRRLSHSKGRVRHWYWSAIKAALAE